MTPGPGLSDATRSSPDSSGEVPWNESSKGRVDVDRLPPAEAMVRNAMRSTRPNAMKAWLVTWEWCGRHAAVADKIAVILPPRYSGKRVADIMQLHYTLATSDLSDMADFAKRRGDAPYKPRREIINSVPCGDLLRLGHNPELYARPVTDLRVWLEPETGFELIEWTEPPIYRWRNDRRGFEIASQGRQERVGRSMHGPLRSELIWDRLLDALKPGYEGCDLGL